MRLLQLRNATLLLEIGRHRLLVDPMLAPPGTMPGFKLFGGGRRSNPLVALPEGADDALASATGAIITHEHPDHLDAAGLRLLRERQIPVWANGVDAPSLARKGLDVHVLDDRALGMPVEVVRSRHGRGLFGWLLGPVCGYYLAPPNEPSVYLVGDSVLTGSVLDAVARLSPDVIVVPAGAANMGIGGDILFSVDELVTLAKTATGTLVFNHLEALDHCPTTRDALRARLRAEGLAHRTHVPDDGEWITLTGNAESRSLPARMQLPEKPGLQKWISAKLMAG